MRNHYEKINRKKYSLGELVEIVSSCTKDSREAVAAVADLIASGRVVIECHGALKRLKLA